MAKKKHPNQKKVGRTPAKVDSAQVQALASICCTQEEIGIIVGCSVTTLHRRFGEEIEKGMAEARASLRRQQFKQALEGNVGMLVWLGKQLLGQRDKKDIHTDGEAALTITERLVTSRLPAESESGNGHKANGDGALHPASRLP